MAGTGGGNNISVTVYSVHADHLGAPRIVTRQSDKAIVWRWDSAESYGGSAPNENPNAFGAFVFNQRFPGQVFDAETGPFQNQRREYNPRIGRYMQSDPIGLGGGVNTYEYVGGKPVMLVDPTGEASVLADMSRWVSSNQGTVAATVATVAVVAVVAATAAAAPTLAIAGAAVVTQVTLADSAGLGFTAVGAASSCKTYESLKYFYDTQAWLPKNA